MYINKISTSDRDITGWVFGKLTAAWPVGLTNKGPKWLCFCLCGGKKITRLDSLLSCRTTSCNCVGYNSAKTHGWGKRPEVQAYRNAKYRCLNPNAQAYDFYGGRGIKFLFKTFDEFIQEMGPRPSAEHSLDRIDNDGNYEPGNVRWATQSEQNRNKRYRVTYAD